MITNLALFHLQRHSDHHAQPSRRYQSLRHFDELPQLPSGYFGMFPLSYVPALWFKVMDPRLLALTHVAGELDRINIDRGAAARSRALRPAPTRATDLAGAPVRHRATRQLRRHLARSSGVQNFASGAVHLQPCVGPDQ